MVSAVESRPSAAAPPRPEPDRNLPLWAVFLGLGLLTSLLYYLLPTAGVAQGVVITGVNAGSAVVTAVVAGRSSGAVRTVWGALALGSLFGTLANAGYYGYPLLTHQTLPYPSVVDVSWVLTYPCFIVAMWGIAQMRRGDDPSGNLLDGLVIATGGATVLWSFVLGPVVLSHNLSPLGHLVSCLNPAMDVVVFGMLVRLLVGGRRNRAIDLLALSFVALLTADIMETIGVSHGWYHIGGPADGIWMASYLLIASAALHPTSGELPTEGADAGHRVTTGRWVFLAAAVVVGPLLLALRHGPTFVIGGASVLTFILVIWRLALLNVHLADASADVRAKSDQLRHQALHDSLTGLANRTLVMDRIEWLLARSRRRNTRCAALFLDLDGFKNVNDTLGHDTGDRLLQAVAARLTSSLREVDTIGRLGGDEFVVLIDDVNLDCAPELVADRIIEVLRQPFELGPASLPVTITTSIGIAIGERETGGDLLRDADVALYQAKAAGKNCFAVFKPEMETSVQRRYEIELDLRSALANKQFELVYQPMFDLDSLDLVGFEALLRWNHPVQGQIQPAEFIPVLESTGQILDVGRWVLDEACRRMAKWRSDGSPLVVSVNVSSRQLDRDVFVEHVRDALETSGIDPAALTIEVTETALMRNVQATAHRLHALKELGVQIAIDDFGTGYSSLAYLQQFPVDCLKIDRTFTEALTRSPESLALIHTLVQLGKDLGLRTLAEGVETSAQMSRLRSEHVNAVQGYLFARPMTTDAVEEHLRRQRSQRAAASSTAEG